MRCIHQIPVLSTWPIYTSKIEIFQDQTQDILSSQQAEFTATLLVDGIILGFAHDLSLENIEPRQKVYDLDERITCLESILEKVKTHKMVISKLRYYKYDYLAIIFLHRA